ncbi:Altered inheritance of mitochondria protein 24, mitochondrial [Conoideocrella luteorostrata]|uniref:Altered inheritance of mitochondria protein 24, mitochondrial n=1 Tax=Conoideocrella luteorostrata TaxID=1105319 RepID=A0AAJ0CIT9_9HYPO|nr:Altered inheritance of mitochondria protein 24, mitochondrial [Conoideocrella luteorostrata]
MMRGSSPLVRSARGLRVQRPAFVCWQCRSIQISATPSTDSPRATKSDAFGASFDSSRDMADARFEVLGSPYSMLSVTLSASQKLYTRRGTLIAVAGRPDNAQSTLSLLNPLTRAAFGVPFVYQRVSSTTPITALISTKSPTTTFSVLHLDGTTDWMVSQRNALLAWTGHTLTLSSRIQRRLGLAHWGSTHLTGRGLAALSAPGQIYQLTLDEGEEFVAHPGSVVAYTVSRNAPQPFRFKSTSLRLQVPSLTSWMPELEFVKTVRSSQFYKFLARTLHNLRTMTRRTIWGDRLFLQFKGPTTILMSSRGVRVADVLSREQVNEIADAPTGALPAAIEQASKPAEVDESEIQPKGEDAASSLRVVPGRKDGKATFEDGKELKDTLR